MEQSLRSECVDKKIAYLTGFFDGEGCVSIGENGNITLRVINTNHDTLLVFQDFFGGSIGERSAIVNKKQYSWSTYGENAVKVAGIMLEHSIEKYDQLKAIIDWHFEREQFKRIKPEQGRGWKANPKREPAIKVKQQLLTKMKMGQYAA